MRFAVALILVLLSSSAFAQALLLSANAPEDKPQSVRQAELEAFEAAIAPSVAEAKASYPAARDRFLVGLPKGQSFFVTTRLYDGTGAFEQVFVAVRNIDNGSVSGEIWSQINRVSGYKLGDDHTFGESEILDWLITHPDGSEEGNFVGKFLDTYRANGG